MTWITYSLSLRPDKMQQRRLSETLETCMNLWNRLADEAYSFFFNNNKIPSAYDLNRHIAHVKKEHPELGRVCSGVLQNVSSRVNRSVTCSLRKIGENGEVVLPRERTLDNYHSFEYVTPRSFLIRDNRLFLGNMRQDVGGIRFKSSRDIKGDIRSCIIVKKKNRWYAKIACELRNRGTLWLDAYRPEVGIDLGLTTLATLSDGTVYKHDRHESIWKDIKKIQRKMSKMEVGSPCYEKLRHRLRKKHKRISNLRKSAYRLIAKEIAENYSLVAIEDIKIRKLISKERWKSVRHSQGSASWGTLIKDLESATEVASTALVKVDPYGTSQKCSRCQHIVAKDLSVRVHECPYCGLVMDRDLNASKNILAAGRAALASSHNMRGSDSPPDGHAGVPATQSQCLSIANEEPVNERATIENLNRSLVDNYLSRINSDLDYDHMSDIEVCRELDIIRSSIESDRLLDAGILMFCQHPELYIDNAHIEVFNMQREIEEGRKERVFKGPIDDQIESALSYIDALCVSRMILKLPEQAESLHIYSYPRSAIKEFLVNAVQHKDYSIPEPVTVYVYPERIEIISQPGPDRTVSKERMNQFDVKGEHARNIRLSAFLKDLQIVQGCGDGIQRALEFLRNNGSPEPEYITGRARTYLKVIIHIHDLFLNPPNMSALDRPRRKRVPSEIKESIIESLRIRGPQAGNKLAEYIGYTAVNNTFRRCINELLDAGEIEYLYPDNPRDRRQRLCLSRRR